MSPIGKLFVVLNLVFSLVILGVVAAILAKSEEYRTMYEGELSLHEKNRGSWDQEKSKLVTEITGHKTDKTQMQERIGNLEVVNNQLKAENESLTADAQQLRNDVSKLTSDYQKFTAALAEVQNHNKQLVTRNEELMSERVDAVNARRAALEDAARLEQQVGALSAQVDQMKTQIEDLESQRGDLSAQIEAAVQSGFDVARVRAAPQIDAVVQNVRPDLGLVVLSVGADDGVTRGTSFEIYSTGEGYKGKVVVDDVYPDNCAARIVRQNMPIEVMDKATTRL